MSVLLYFALATGVVAPTFGQASQARFERFTIADGLSQNSGNTLLKDAFGFLWIGTKNGLDRYDNHKFKRFSNIKGDSTSLSDGYVRILFEDSHNDLWIGTNIGGVHKYLPANESFIRFDITSLLDPASVTSGNPNEIFDIAEAGLNKYWLGTGAGLVFLDATLNEAHLVDYGASVTTPVRQLIVDHQGTLWIGTNNGGVYACEISPDAPQLITHTSTILIAHAPVRALHEDHAGNILIGTYGRGLYRFITNKDDLQTFRFNKPGSISIASDSITAINQDRKGRLWIGYNSKGFSINDESSMPRHFLRDPADPYSLVNNEVFDILFEEGGAVWIGTWDGLSRMSLNFESIRLYTYSKEEGGLQHPRVVSFEEDGNDQFWLATYGNGLIIFDRNEERFTKHPDKLCGNQLLDITKDRNENLWVATIDGGLCYLEPSRKEVIQFNHLSDTSEVFTERALLSVMESTDGLIWIGTRLKGLNVFEPRSNQLIKYRKSEDDTGLNSDYIWPIIQDRSGTIWLGAFDGGLLKYDKANDRFERFELDDGNPGSNRIYDLFQDSKTNLWVATDDGVKQIDIDSMAITSYRKEQGLAHDNVRGIVEDDFGFIWMSTNNGLSRFSPSDSTFKNFYVEDGLQGNRFFARSVMKASNGDLFFGGGDGFNIIDPALIQADTSNPKIILREILVHNEPHDLPGSLPPYLAEKIFFEDDENQFTLSFTTLNFDNISQNKYRYKLTPVHSGWFGFESAPIDTGWVDLGNVSTIPFPALDYGDYVFEVQGSNSDGIWSEPGLSLPITIDTPWYATGWFRVIVLLSFIGLITGAVLIRTRYLLGIERLRVRIAQGLHDDVGANLATIAMRLGMLKSRMKISERERLQLSKLSEMARETGQTIRETGWLINAKYDNLNRLVTQMKDLSHTMLDGHVIHSFSQSPAQMPALKLNTDLKQNVYLLFKEALNNANKSAEASKVDIDVKFEQKKFALRIQDNGKGFDPATIKKGSGLDNMKSRAEAINAQFELVSEPGNGTTITLIVPVRY